MSDNFLPPDLQAYVDKTNAEMDEPLPADHWWNRLADKPIPPEGLTIRFVKEA